ncbi:hypothetical protein TWF694_005649 [Orbilia ellipsospora]|uniref:Delta 8-(E)-sphingolipid desaturase n=1 Tax=Orbilia ellipsospora TaxID=2528407 RepID=A0AAV9WT57_9PEZI
MSHTVEEKAWSRREIENLIAEGKCVVIVDDKVLKVDAWMKYHPGGDLAIKHMIGRDATLEVTAFHSAETKKSMLKYKIGRIQGPWVSFTPPIQGGRFRFIDDETPNENDIPVGALDTLDLVSSGSTTPTSASTTSEPDFILDHRLRLRKPQVYASSISSVSDNEVDGEVILSPKHDADRRAQEDLLLYPSLDLATQQNIIAKYRVLDKKLRDKGLYECNYWNYVRDFTRYSVFFGLFVYLLKKEWFTLAAVCLGIFWHQITFTAHDAGHMGITHNYAIDTFVGIFIADFCGGLSLGWWKRSHNVRFDHLSP